MAYSVKFKKAAVEKLLAYNSPGLFALAKGLGISKGSLKPWRDFYAREIVDSEVAPPMVKNKRPQDWSAQEKFQAMLETAHLSQEEKAAYCREHGLYVRDLQRWDQGQGHGDIAVFGAFAVSDEDTAIFEVQVPVFQTSKLFSP